MVWPLREFRFIASFECSYPAVFYYLNNYKIPAKTQHKIDIICCVLTGIFIIIYNYKIKL